MEKNQRLPRPMGVTSLMLEYKQTNNPEVLVKLRRLLIHEWFLRGNILFNKPLNIYELSSLLNCEVSFIHEHMKQQMFGSKVFQTDADKQQGLIKELIGQSIAWVLEDRNEIQNQVDILRVSQNGTYKPFISSEVIKALALKNTNSGALLNVIKTISGGGTINIFNQNNNSDNNGVTVEKALELIKNENAKLKSPIKPHEILEAEYEIIDLPEVVATKQYGIDLEKEALTMSKPELLSSIDDYKGALLESDETHHELRREIELRIDPDEVDPEIGPY